MVIILRLLAVWALIEVLMSGNKSFVLFTSQSKEHDYDVGGEIIDEEGWITPDDT